MNKALRIKIFFSLVLLASYCMLFTTKSYAADLSLGVYPPIIQVTVENPPASINAPVTVSNFGDETVVLNILIKPFTQNENENGEVKFLNSNETKLADPNIFEKIKIMQDDNVTGKIEIPPGEKKTVNLHIGLPKDEPLADYYFSVFFVSETKNSPGTNSSHAAGGITTNVLLSIGKEDAKGAVTEFSTPLFIQKGPVPFKIRVKNKGNHVITPMGVILIKNMFGQTIGKVDLLPVNILSGTIRQIPSLQLNSTASAEILKEIAKDKNSSIAYWPESFLLGPYQASLTIALSDKGPVFKRTINFVGFPLEAVIGLIVAAIITSVLVIKVKKRLAR